MPREYIRTFRVRHYECDAYGHVNNAVYLRYMQEAAFDASSAAGYDLARYRAMDRHWLVRDTDIEYLMPLRYGDSVQVKTWVADFRRVCSRRAYEFYDSDSGRLVARAHTDWAYLDTNCHRPAAIPEEMKTAFFPEGAPQSAPPRHRFPAAPPPPPGVFKTWRRVEWRDLDPAGHVNNAIYLAFLEDCALQTVAAHGWPAERMLAAGFAIVARRHQLEYKQPTHLNDELEVATWASDMRRSSALRHFIISRVSDGAQLFRARTYWVWVEPNSGRPIRIPESFLADLAPNIASAPGNGKVRIKDSTP